MRIIFLKDIASSCYCFLSLVLVFCFSEFAYSQDRDSDHVYELRTYTAAKGKLKDLHSRFEDHTLKLFAKHGMKSLFYSTPLDKKDTLVYLLQHDSREAAKKSWKEFISDPNWKEVFKDSRNNGALVTKVQSMFLKKTDFAPKEVSNKDEISRVFELRTYTTAEGRLPNLLKRFREGETDLFKKHGMTNIIFWTPLDKKNTMVYVLAHKNKKAAAKSWKAFFADPQWKKIRKKSLASGPIVIKVQNMFLTPTEYSPFK